MYLVSALIAVSLCVIGCSSGLWFCQLKSEKWKGQSRMENPETLLTFGTRANKTNKNNTTPRTKIGNTDPTKNWGWTQVLE
jgi:hypothetical protein